MLLLLEPFGKLIQLMLWNKCVKGPKVPSPLLTQPVSHPASCDQPVTEAQAALPDDLSPPRQSAGTMEDATAH